MWLSLLCVWKENGVVPSAEMGVALGRSHSLFTWPPQALSLVSWWLVLCENVFHHNLLSQHPLRPLLSTTVVHMWVGVTISNPSILVQPPFPEAPPPAMVVLSSCSSKTTHPLGLNPLSLKDALGHWWYAFWCAHKQPIKLGDHLYLSWKTLSCKTLQICSCCKAMPIQQWRLSAEFHTFSLMHWVTM